MSPQYTFRSQHQQYLSGLYGTVELVEDDSLRLTLFLSLDFARLLGHVELRLDVLVHLHPPSRSSHGHFTPLNTEAPRLEVLCVITVKEAKRLLDW